MYIYVAGPNFHRLKAALMDMAEVFDFRLFLMVDNHHLGALLGRHGVIANDIRIRIFNTPFSNGFYIVNNSNDHYLFKRMVRLNTSEFVEYQERKGKMHLLLSEVLNRIKYKQKYRALNLQSKNVPKNIEDVTQSFTKESKEVKEIQEKKSSFHTTTQNTGISNHLQMDGMNVDKNVYIPQESWNLSNGFLVPSGGPTESNGVYTEPEAEGRDQKHEKEDSVPQTQEIDLLNRFNVFQGPFTVVHTQDQKNSLVPSMNSSIYLVPNSDSGLDVKKPLPLNGVVSNETLITHSRSSSRPHSKNSGQVAPIPHSVPQNTQISNQESIVQVCLPIFRGHVGKIIGIGATNIKRLEKLSNTRICIDRIVYLNGEATYTRNIIIRGTQAQIELAKKLIVDSIKP